MMNMYIRLNLMTTALLLTLTAQTSLANTNEGPDFVKKYIQDPILVGQGQFQRLFWKIYDARLYASQGSYIPGEAFALQLEYMRDLPSQGIVEKSIELIAAQGVSNKQRLETWKQLLENVIPDISEGDKLTGIRLGSISYFYLNDELAGQISEPQLSQYFFDIWLGEDTTAPDLRLELLGQKPSASQ